MIKVMAVDLQKCCSEDDLSTAPWRFFLSFFSFLVLLYYFSKVRISPLKVTIYNYSGTMFSHVLYYIVNFEIIALDK